MFGNKNSGNVGSTTKQVNKESIIVGSAISTVILFIIFAILQYCESPILELNSKWIFVSLVPLLLALIYTGAIKSFKGFGIEFETNLTDTVTDFDIADNVETVEVPQIEKADIRQVLNLNKQKKKQIERLKFTLRRRNYYNVNIITEYFRNLPNLKFIELTERNGKFRYLISVKHFRSRQDNEDNTDRNEIEKLISAIEENNVLRYFPNAISQSVSVNLSLIDTYKFIESTSQGRFLYDQILPVVNKEGIMVGIVSRRKIERSISKQVLEVLNKE